MRHYTNNFMGYTTIVIEIEKDLKQEQVESIVEELNSIAGGKFKPSCYQGPLKIINKHDEDIRIGHKFVIMCRQNESLIQATINDIAEMI